MNQNDCIVYFVTTKSLQDRYLIKIIKCKQDKALNQNGWSKNLAFNVLNICLKNAISLDIREDICDQLSIPIKNQTKFKEQLELQHIVCTVVDETDKILESLSFLDIAEVDDNNNDN